MKTHYDLASVGVKMSGLFLVVFNYISIELETVLNRRDDALCALKLIGTNLAFLTMIAARFRVFAKNILKLFCYMTPSDLLA